MVILYFPPNKQHMLSLYIGEKHDLAKMGKGGNEYSCVNKALTDFNFSSVIFQLSGISECVKAIWTVWKKCALSEETAAGAVPKSYRT